MRRLTDVLLAAGTMLLAGCGNPPYRESLHQVASWVTTGAFITNRWRAGTIPSPYAAHALGAARDAVRQEVATISRQYPDSIGAFRPLTNAATQDIGALAAAVARHDTTQTELLYARLVPIQHQLRQLAAAADASERGEQ